MIRYIQKPKYLPICTNNIWSYCINSGPQILASTKAQFAPVTSIVKQSLYWRVPGYFTKKGMIWASSVTQRYIAPSSFCTLVFESLSTTQWMAGLFFMCFFINISVVIYLYIYLFCSFCRRRLPMVLGLKASLTLTIPIRIYKLKSECRTHVVSSLAIVNNRDKGVIHISQKPERKTIAPEEYFPP